MATKKTVVPPASDPNERAVIIAVDRRSVYFAYTSDPYVHMGTMKLKRVRQCIYWGTKHGIGQLATEGPQPTGRYGALVPELTTGGVVVEYGVTPEAEAKWAALK